MSIVKVTRKGQITIPKGIRDTLNIKEGDLLKVEERDGRIIIKKLGIPEQGKPEGIEEYMKIINELEEVRKNWR